MLNGTNANHSGSKDQSLYGQFELKCVEQAQKRDIIKENWDETNERLPKASISCKTFIHANTQ